MNCTNNLSVVATLCAIIAFCSFVECSSETAQVVEGVGLHQLKLIGAVGTRSYFVEANQSMSWTAADAYCEASGLKLVTVEAAAQATFLKTNLETHYTGYGFWTAAREDRTAAGYVWNSDGTTKLDGTLVDTWNAQNGAYSLCAIIHASAAKLSLSGKPCSDDNWLVLCQSP